ncbi:MAG: hypothetical protein GXO75_02895 [Calditrichaeota bacterium]|nr:hypothetical protein [Calditrichota bacterium]
MNEKIFKYLAIFFFLIVIMSLCNKRETKVARYNVNVQTVTSSAEGLDLKAVGELVKKAKDAKSLEKMLNSPSSGVNNLDLNEDGKADYISVTEYGNDKVKGFSLTTQPSPGETQEIATIEIEKTSDSNAEMQIHGNEQIYGRNYYQRSSFGLMDFLILGYLFRPHTMYASPWNYGRYPPSYSPYRTMPNSTYRNRMNQATRNSSFSRASSPAISSTVKSPNSGKAAKSIRAPLKNPTASQKQFQARNPSKQMKSGGFGRRSTSRARSVRRSSYRRSGGFSGGK